MDFNDSPVEAEYRAKVRAFLSAHYSPYPDGERAPAFAPVSTDEAVRASQAWQATKFDAGWACLTWPKEYGGQNATPIEQVIWSQEESTFQTPANIFTIGIGMLGPTIMKHGTAPQKADYLPRLARGDDIWCQLFSEPSAGSDLAGLRTRAVQDGDEWIVNGQKIWTSGAHYCRYGMVITRSDPSARKHKGLTYFIVDMESPGIDVRQIRQINGAANFNEVFFDDVRIPDRNRVGEIGGGWTAALTTLMNERATISSVGLGGFGPQNLLKLAMEVDSYRERAIDDVAVRQTLADFFVTASGLSYTAYRTLTAISKGEVPGAESSINKMVGGALRQRMAEYGMELQGIAGTVMDPDFQCQAQYLGSPGSRIAGGSDEIMRNIVAERVLGLPADIRVDKELPFNELPKGTKG
ncbi:MAG: acyl-CoA dehydrogenase family protein [Pseudomonadota bacterium]